MDDNFVLDTSQTYKLLNNDYDSDEYLQIKQRNEHSDIFKTRFYILLAIFFITIPSLFTYSVRERIDCFPSHDTRSFFPKGTTQ